MTPSPTTLLEQIPQLEDNIEPSNFMPELFWTPLMIAGASALLLVLLMLILYLAYRKKSVVPPPTSKQIALTALDKLRHQEIHMQEFSITLSMIMRQFIAGQTQDPALFETHQEFSQRIDSLSALPPKQQYAMHSLLDHLAELKYAGARDHDEQRANELLTRSRNLILEMSPEQAQQEAASSKTTRNHALLLPLAAANIEDAARGSEFIFASANWLWFLLLLIPMLMLRRRQGSSSCINHPGLRFLSDKPQVPATLTGRLGPLLYCLALAALIITLAQPQMRHKITEEKVSGIDIMIACDLSGSMETRDMVFSSRDARNRLQRQRVDRLTAAKSVINEFIAARPNDRIGVVAFAGKTKLRCPLTLDHTIAIHIINEFYLEDPHSGRRGYINEHGTAIGSAIAAAALRLEERKETKSKVIILVTDGQSNMGSISPIEAAKQAATLGIRIFPIAIGEQDGRISRSVISAGVDEKSLRKIAMLSKGRYFRASSGQQLSKAFSSIDQLEKSEVKKRSLVSFETLYYYPLSLACLLLCFGFALNNLRPQPAP